MALGTIAILDDDPEVLSYMTGITSERFIVYPVQTISELKSKLRLSTIQAAVIDLHIAEGNTFDYLDLIRTLYPYLGIVIVTGDSESELYERAIKLGADDLVNKSDADIRLNLAIENAIKIRQSAQANRSFQAQINFSKTPYFIPDDAKFRSSVETALQAVKAGLNLLILGDTGCGKDMLARHIHESVQANAPYVPVNCSAIPASLAESELFGREKGAYTDSTDTKLGLIEYASNGILFLDEIGCMPLEIQSKLLRALEEKMIRRLGGTQAVPVSFSLISATNRDLEEASSQHMFREDLFYRINQVTIKLPSLRDNHHLLESYIHYFVSKMAEKYNSKFSIPNSLYAQWMTLEWRGNIRQLRNEIERLFLLGVTDNYVDEPRKEMDKTSLSEQLSQLERNLISTALFKSAYNVSLAARELGIKRESLQKKMTRLGFKSPRNR